MRINFVFLTFLILFTNVCYSQTNWFWQNPLPQGNTLYDVKLIGNGVAVAVGEYGTLLRSTDEGLSWNLLKYDSGLVNQSISFINNETGWITSVSNDFTKILKTTNSGFNWYEISYFQFQVITSIEFISLDTGFVSVKSSAGNPSIYKSMNGGVTWNPISFQPSQALIINSTDFLNSFTGFICGPFGISKTTNGGINWVNKFNISGLNTFIGSKIKFLNSLSGIVAGTLTRPLSTSVGLILKTSNAGENWIQTYSLDNSTHECLDFINQYTGFAGGTGMISTTNMGNNWITISFSEKLDLKTLSMLSDKGIATGLNGLMLNTSNNGLNWSNLFPSFRTQYSVNSIRFYNKQIGYAAVDKYVLKTTNAGKNWYSMNTNSPTQLLCLFIIDSNVVYAAGGNTATNCPVVKTTNGGLDWVLQNPNAGNGYINDIFFTNSNTGYCTSFDGISKTTNAGEIWTHLSIPNTGFLNSLYFPNANTGFLIGYTKCFKTTNSGSSWVEIPVNGESIFFQNPDTGYVCGVNNSIKKTTNGGITWFIQTQSNSFDRFYEIRFINSTIGFAVGNSVARTTNGGHNWVYQKLPTKNTFFSIYGTDSNNIYLSGEKGTILKSTNGGIIISISKSSEIIPINSHLKQNFPNPFNPITKIQFDIIKESYTKLIIYDLQGKVIHSLVNEKLKPGSYEVEWNGSDSPTGIYFYKLSSEDFSTTKKMVLLK